MDGEFGESYVRRLSEGDKELLRQFVSHFGELLYIRLQARFRDVQLIEDVCQETLTRVLSTIRNNPSSIQQPEKLGHYVNAVCSHVILERLRGDGKYQPASAESLDRADPAISVERQMITSERQEQVHILLEELSVRDRILLRDVFLYERDKDDICRDYAVDRTYLRVLLFRARQRLRDLMLKKK